MTTHHVPQASPFPLLPLRNGALFPGTVITLPMGRKRSLALLQALQPNEVFGIAVQRDPRVTDPGIADMFPVGTFARVREVVRQGGNVRLTIEGLARFEITNLVSTDPYWRAEGRLMNSQHTQVESTPALVQALFSAIEDLAPVMNGGSTAEEFVQALRGIADPALLADRVAAALGMNLEKEVQLLSTVDVNARLTMLVEFINELRTTAEVRTKIDADVRREFSNHQREAILRQQLRSIKKELGEEEEGDRLSELRKKLDEAKLPAEARKAADRELRRLESMGQGGAEQGVITNYLQWLADVPWAKHAEVKTDLKAVQEQLDSDHFGLDEVKQRILEHLAVLKIGGDAKGNILCLVGPPGVGKTSLGRSVAEATGRPLVRVSLGGVRDEAEIRGHRRTYVGALPGRIMNALKQAGVNNPVCLLDEIDKLGQGWAGSPEAALLEVLDPEQNGTFTDHYMEVPFDLSQVLFICTANTLETLSAPLRDRMEVIEVSGYTLEEKLHVARKHLIPKKLKEHGLAPELLELPEASLKGMVAHYTREAGVRQLAQQITKLCRALALQMAREPDAKAQALVVDEAALSKHLGKPRFFNEVAERTMVPGVATGLAWTPVGGDILFIETSRMMGSGKLEITGQLGDVMKESARAALTYVRSNAKALGVDPVFLSEQDLHIHVPAGAVPKDGPSAGVTMFTALTSLLTHRKVRSDTAMTGEATLRGRVLPVGGIKEKVLAAHRAGLKRVILPKQNERDAADVPEAARAALEFIFAEDMSQVLAAALENDGPGPMLGSGSGGAGDKAAAHVPEGV